jgi:hypothetical protein
LETKDITGYEFYVITLNNGETKQHSTPKQIMVDCLFKEKRWGRKMPSKPIALLAR